MTKYEHIFGTPKSDFILRIPLSGGKAGKDVNGISRAKTSNIQVYNKYFGRLYAQFSFKRHDQVSKEKAIERAKIYLTKL